MSEFPSSLLPLASPAEPASQHLPAQRRGGAVSLLLELITVIIPAPSSVLVPFVPSFLPAHLQI